MLDVYSCIVRAWPFYMDSYGINYIYAIKNGIRTVRYTDTSLRTVWYGHFATGQFAIWTVRYTDSSLHGQFATRTVRYMDSSLHGQFATLTVRYTDSSLNRYIKSIITNSNYL